MADELSIDAINGNRLSIGGLTRSTQNNYNRGNNDSFLEKIPFMLCGKKEISESDMRFVPGARSNPNAFGG